LPILLDWRLLCAGVLLWGKKVLEKDSTYLKWDSCGYQIIGFWEKGYYWKNISPIGIFGLFVLSTCISINFLKDFLNFRNCSFNKYFKIYIILQNNNRHYLSYKVFALHQALLWHGFLLDFWNNFIPYFSWWGLLVRLIALPMFLMMTLSFKIHFFPGTSLILSICHKVFMSL